MPQASDTGKWNQKWNIKMIIILYLVLKSTFQCFVVHYVLYYEELPLKYYLQMSQNTNFPYLVHLNQPLNLPNNRTFTRQITPVQMSDIKKVQVIYHHGGLYLDNDQQINYQCIKQYICHLTGLYFLDWTQIKQRWKLTVPLSFIYASHPGNQTLLKSIEGLDQNKTGDNKGPRTVYFSGPSHMQEYRSGMGFVKVPKNCQFHRADKTWVQGKSKSQIAYQNNVDKRIIAKYSQRQKDSRDKYIKLWKTHTVLYPFQFDLGIQHRIDETYNHVEVVDKVEGTIRVIQYSKIKETREKLQSFLREYQPDEIQQNGKQKDGLQNRNRRGGKIVNVVGDGNTNKQLQIQSNITKKLNETIIQSKASVIQSRQPITAKNKTNLSVKQQNKTILNKQGIRQLGMQKHKARQPLSPLSSLSASPSPQSSPSYQQQNNHNNISSGIAFKTIILNLIILINNNFLISMLFLLFSILGIGYVCYKNTKCCKNNNYQKQQQNYSHKSPQMEQQLSQQNINNYNNANNKNNTQFEYTKKIINQFQNTNSQDGDLIGKKKVVLYYQEEDQNQQEGEYEGDIKFKKVYQQQLEQEKIDNEHINKNKSQNKNKSKNKTRKQKKYIEL